jgi:hypothetical protein
MNTSVIAGKYGVDSLKPLFLESLELRNLIDEHYRSAKIVYDADVDDGIFREFFKRELMIKLEDVFGLGGRDLSLSIHKNLPEWGTSGGHLGADLAWTLADKTQEKQDAD